MILIRLHRFVSAPRSSETISLQSRNRIAFEFFFFFSLCLQRERSAARLALVTLNFRCGRFDDECCKPTLDLNRFRQAIIASLIHGERSEKGLLALCSRNKFLSHDHKTRRERCSFALRNFQFSTGKFSLNIFAANILSDFRNRSLIYEIY